MFPYVGKTDKVELTDKEKGEFDHISFDAICKETDINKLRKLEAYMRQEGFDPTAQAARNRLKDLGNPVLLAGDPELVKAQDALQKEATAEYLEFLGEIKERDQALKAAGSGKVGLTGEGGAVPVRKGPEPPPELINAPQPQQPIKGDSTLGGQVRSGTDYYSKWDKLAKEMDEGDEGPEEDEGKVKDAVKSAVKADNDASESPSMSKGTVERLSKANMSLSKAERDVLALREKEKGNDLFRAREFTSALAAYSLSLELSPAKAAVLSNRAAVHMKMKSFKEAEKDCGAALEAEPWYFKAFLRRAACRMELKDLQGAIEDANAGLEIDPECKELKDICEKATAELERNSMKRLTIEEVSDGEESDEDEEIEMEAKPSGGANAAKVAAGGAGEDFLPCPEWGGPLPGYFFGTGKGGTGYYRDPKQPQTAAEPPAAAAAQEKKSADAPVTRTRIAVVEDDEEEEEEKVPQASAPVKKKIVVEEESDDEEDEDEVPSSPVVEVEPEEASLSEQAEVLKARANKLFGEGKLQEAADTFSRALRLAPSNAILLNNRSACRLRLGEQDAAEADAGVAAVLDESYGKAWLRLGQCRKSQGRLGAALATFREAATHLPAAQKPLVEREISEVTREIARKEKERSKARNSSSKAASSSDSKATYNKGTVEIEEIDSDDEDEGSDDEALSEKFPDGDVLVHFRADAAKRKRDAERAEGEWEQRRMAREKRIAEAEAARTKAKQAKQANNKSKASSSTPVPSKKPEQSPSSAPAKQASAAPMASSPKASSPAAAPAIDPELLKLEGNAAFKKGDMRAAEAAWGNALAADPANAAILANRAMLYLQIGNFEGCIADCETALKGDPVNVKALHRRAKAKHQLGRLQEALREYEALEARLPGVKQLSEELAALRKQIKEEKETEDAKMDAAWEAIGETTKGKTDGSSKAKPPLIKQPEGPSTPPKAASPRTPGAPVKVEVVSDDEEEDIEPEGTKRGETVVRTREVKVEVEEDAAKTAAAEPAAVPQRRKIVVEESDDDEEEEEAPKAAAASAAPAAAAPARRKIVVEESSDDEEEEKVEAKEAPSSETLGNRRKIVVEEEDSDDEEAEAATGAAAAAEAPAAPPEAAAPTKKKIEVKEVEEAEEEVKPAPLAETSKPSSTKQEKPDPAAVAALKDAGNASFKAGNMPMAIVSYNAAISLDPTEPSLFANRAMAHLKAFDYKACESDCRATLKLEPGHVKARHRLATALRHLGSLEEAADLLAALRKDLPGNRSVQEDFEAVMQLMQEEREALDPVTATSAAVKAKQPPPPPAAAAPAEPAASNPTRRKIPVVEDDSDSEDEDEEEKPSEAQGSSSASESGSKAAAPTKAALHEAAAAKAAAAIRVQQAAASTKLPAVPKSATEFERASKTLSSDPEKLASYVRQLKPAELPNVFKSSLSASAIGFVAQAISKGGMLPGEAAFASEMLSGLTKCDRFSMTAMLMSGKDKASVKEAIEGLKSAGIDVASLKKQFKA